MGASGGGGRSARALRVLLLIVLFGSILLITENLTPHPVKMPTKAVNVTKDPLRILVSSETVKINFNNTTVNNVANITEQNNFTQRNSVISMPPIIRRLNGIITGYYATHCREQKKEIKTGRPPGSPKSIPQGIAVNSSVHQDHLLLPNCEISSDLGPIAVDRTAFELSVLHYIKKYPEVGWGGRYSPTNCKAKHKVAIIVPFRDRHQHLAIFLNHMHPFLMKQQIEYGIFIVEQEGNSGFNRAKLMNVGFAESQKQKAGGWQCFVFHDIDMLPADLRNLYSCARQPRHMAAAIDKFNFKLPYEDYFGGVSAMTSEQFQDVNGFSNGYWGWGGEDDDMSIRIKMKGYNISRYDDSIAQYVTLDHKPSQPNPKRFTLLSESYKQDGLLTLHYEVVQTNHHHLYTHILVRI